MARPKGRSRSTMRSQFDDNCLMGLTICFGKLSELDAALAVVIRNPALSKLPSKRLGRDVGCMGAMLMPG